MKPSKRIHNRKEVTERLMFIRKEVKRSNNVNVTTIKQNSKRTTRKHLNNLPNNLSLAVKMTIKKILKSYGLPLALQGVCWSWVNVYWTLGSIFKSSCAF